ncbi:hypothetical protein CLCR_00715 [Cladophialophora carrionii]|uniref:Uncharacterized protein n=1 Tax=Cladophialophora carrionii TaxID=86049 RepID=A0A1C1C6H2_9EURO|nr:hypothetical protein CLCR_00715 [Cladophialophora carrionii]
MATGPGRTSSQLGAQGVLDELNEFFDYIPQILRLLKHVDGLHLESISRDGDLVADFQVIEGQLGFVSDEETLDLDQFSHELDTYGHHLPHTTGMLRRLTSEGIFDMSDDDQLVQAAQHILHWQDSTGQDIQGVHAGQHYGAYE